VISVEGDNHWTVYCNDSYGNIYSNQIKFIKDITPPVILFSCSPLNVFINEIISCSCTAIDNLDPNPSINYTANPLTFSVGLYDTSCNSSDFAGNFNNTKIVYQVTLFPSGGGSGSEGGGSNLGRLLTSYYGILELNSSKIDITTFSNEISYYKIKMKNIGKADMNVTIITKGLDNILSLTSSNYVIINENSSQISTFKITAPKFAGVYTGKIIFNDKEVLVTINVNEDKVIFDLDLDILNNLRTLDLNETLLLNISFVPLNINNRIDSIIHYIIKDFYDNAKYYSNESLSINGAFTIFRNFSTNFLSGGDYIFGIELHYPDGVAVSSESFSIRPEKFKVNLFYLFVLFLLFITLLIIIIIIFRKKLLNLKFTWVKRFINLIFLKS
jgi:hypothetical protein